MPQVIKEFRLIQALMLNDIQKSCQRMFSYRSNIDKMRPIMNFKDRALYNHLFHLAMIIAMPCLSNGLIMFKMTNQDF